MKMSKCLKFETQFKPDEKGCTDWISKDNLISAGLGWGNNGVMRRGIFNNIDKYCWEKKPTRGPITHLRSIGYNKNPYLNKHPIRSDILQQLIQKYVCCQSCGSCKHLLPDHKNDDYNDKRVLNKETQLLTDFQLLCNSCNIKKARENKKNKEIGKRTPAPYLYTSIGFPKFIEGNDDYISGIDAQKGTFWYDIKAYKEFIKTFE